MENPYPRDNVNQGGHNEGAYTPVPPNNPASPDGAQETGNRQGTQIDDIQRSLRDAEKWMIWLTGAMAFFALCSVMVGLLQWSSMRGQLAEVKSGSVDTHQLAEATKSQAEASKEIATAAKSQADNSASQAAAMKQLAERALAQATATNTLASEAKRSADIAQSQSAPWVGIEQARTIQVYPPRYGWMPEPLGYPTIWVEVRFPVRNYGNSPAFRETETVTFAPVPERGEDLPTLRNACLIDAFRRGQVTYQGDIGEMMLPGATKNSGYDSNMVHDVRKTKALKRIWITICITYQDVRNEWHYSGYRYISSPADGVPFTFPDHPGWSYLPFTGASLVAASAE
jgi:hypothetical protein